MPPPALISSAASCAACRIETPRGWENGPDTPMRIGRPSLLQAVTTRVAHRKASLRKTPPKGGSRGKVKRRLSRTQCRATHLSTSFARGCPDRCGQYRPGWAPSSERARPGYVGLMYAQRRLCAFSAALERVLAARDAAAFEAEWITQDLQQVGWEALALARQANTEALEPVLAQVDRRLLAVLERCRAFVDSHLVTFRVPELERWQHAAAAALVGARWGVAGLRTVIADTRAPVGRRYFAFLALAERPPPRPWGLVLKYPHPPHPHHPFLP